TLLRDVAVRQQVVEVFRYSTGIVAELAPPPASRRRDAVPGVTRAAKGRQLRQIPNCAKSPAMTMIGCPGDERIDGWSQKRPLHDRNKNGRR
ncbi:hypothetical protein ABTI15_19785, partial [Acinetobacter baumannii]